MRAEQRIIKVQRFLVEQNLDAIIVRANSDLFWLTGFENTFDNEQAHVAIITRDACILHTDGRYVTVMREKAREEGVWKIDDRYEQEVEFVERMLKDLKLVTGRVAINEAMSLSLYRKYSDAMPNARFKERADDIVKLRAIKDADEIVLMKQAQDIASEAFMQTVSRLQPGMTERDISIELEFIMKRLGAEELAFANIVASGPNSAKPHAIPSNRILESGDFVVFDFGARINGYCSDTTRTICIEQASEEQLRMYDAVRHANEWVAASIKPEVTGSQMHRLAESELAKAGYRDKMGHSLGHGVGIDVHEQPMLSLNNKEPLLEGNVVTIEPGIYIPGKCGVRIEDCGVITESGFESFCGLSHELMVIE